MQNAKLNKTSTPQRDDNSNLSPGTSNGGSEPKFYHYCYVCNTQLNSCKQALLHCSGKRHKKKLHFLQSRKHAVAPLPGGSAIGAAPMVQRNGLNFPPLQQQQQQQQQQQHIEMMSFYPSTVMLSPAAVAGTEQWLHASPIPPRQQQQQQQQQFLYQQHSPLLYTHQQPRQLIHLPPSIVPPVQPVLPQSYLPAIVHPSSVNDCSSVSSCSPLFGTTGSSSYSSNKSSAVISPSELSSMSSELSNGSHKQQQQQQPCSNEGYKCRTCGRLFTTGALLHSHLQSARHYKHHLHHFRGGDRSGVDSSSSSSDIYYCLLCSIAVNSHTQLHSHHNGVRHKQKAEFGQEQQQLMQHSRCSSASSEPAVELVEESGYASGSGDEALLRSRTLLNSDDSSFKCQLCNVVLTSNQQEKQHLISAKHMLKMSGSRLPFRRKSINNSFRKKCSIGHVDTVAINDLEQLDDDVDDHSDLCSATPSPDPTDADSTTLTVRPSI